MGSIAPISMLCLAAVLALLISPSRGQPLRYCRAPDIPRNGRCAAGGRDCFFLVLGRYSARQMPRKIRCVNVGRNKSKCTSEIVCGIPS